MRTSSFLEFPISTIKGLGPKRAAMISSELNISSIYDLLLFTPSRYIDKRSLSPISAIKLENTLVQTTGILSNIRLISQAKGYRLTADLFDDSDQIELVWFKGYQYIEKQLKENQRVRVFGKVNRFHDRFSIVHPEVSPIGELPTEIFKGNIEPIYPIPEKIQKAGISQRLLRSILRSIVEANDFSLAETLPEYILKAHSYASKTQALRHIHRPENLEQTQSALDRFKFEELFYMQLGLLIKKQHRKQSIKGRKFETVGALFLKYYETSLPFELTDAQKRVLREIRNDMGSGLQMNRLLQGDVGSGKTMVALLSCLIAIGNKSQACLVAPTEILAQQHFEDLSSQLVPLGIKVELLTGSTSKKDRKDIHQALLNGDLHLLIGTHAIFEEQVVFCDLGLAIIDEQHRFGVAQRSKLWRKAQIPPHILVMTATPIPRTLAMSVYGDLDVSVIDELPPGRTAIITTHRNDGARLRVFSFLKEQIALGRQIYVVYPLIKESEALDYKDLMDGYESISREFPAPQYAISILHGQMSTEAKNYEMRQFESGVTQIMVATTVIEVGVNVPNATVMVIESAERFGLAQLHQLRGRVGRGVHQSYCLLMTKKQLSDDAMVRMTSMVKYHSGFELSEIDLRLRGPGDIMGTQQSGSLQLKFADLIEDSALLFTIRTQVQRLLESDPDLKNSAHSCMIKPIQMMLKGKILWSYIS